MDVSLKVGGSISNHYDGQQPNGSPDLMVPMPHAHRPTTTLWRPTGPVLTEDHAVKIAGG
jgi:hypothetical protein